MSERDLRRIEVLSDVRAGRRTVAAAAAVLAISERQAFRLLARYEVDGGSGLQCQSFVLVPVSRACRRQIGLGGDEHARLVLLHRETRAVGPRRSFGKVSLYVPARNVGFCIEPLLRTRKYISREKR